MKNLNGTEKQNKWALDIVTGINEIADCERKTLFIEHATAAFIIDHKNLKLPSMINMFIENDLIDNKFDICSVYGLEKDSDEYFDKIDELEELPSAK